MQPSKPRRLLVSPDGVAHLPTCRHVPITAESGPWGEIIGVEQAIDTLRAGGSVPTLRPARKTPGPRAVQLCRHCLGKRR